MSGNGSDEAARRIARDMVEAERPTEEIIRHLVERGVERNVAVSIVFNNMSANNYPQEQAARSDPITQRLDREERIIAAFRRVWHRQLATVIPALGALLLVFFGMSDRKGELLGLVGEDWAQIGLAIIVGVVIFSFFNYRCPACNSYLGKGLLPSYCRHCGVRLS